MNKFITGVGRISCFLLLLLAGQALAASHNLLRGDADVETEYRSMTYGTWSSFTLGNYDRMNFD